jgi:hypothetical protein
VSLSFSPDGKQLLAQGGGPEWNLLLFAWERAKVTACVRATNNQGAPLCKVGWVWAWVWVWGWGWRKSKVHGGPSPCDSPPSLWRWCTSPLQCALSPGDGSLATALGPGVLRIFR